RESGTTGHQCSSKEPVKEKMSLQRKWASEPADTKQSTFADREAKKHESLPSGATGGLAPQQKYAFTGNSGKVLSGPAAVRAMAGPPSQDPPGPFAQGFPRGYCYQLGQPYPQHPQSERFLSGAKPQPGLEPHAWPFAGQLPSEDLYSVGHPVHAHPHGLGSGRFPRQKSPSLPSSFDKYPQSGSEPAEEGHSKKEQKPKKPGKYICHYCGRACAKPSVLKKHIRSHTGERPYPCIPCGFSFKTKSNLYKHRKSHAHAIKAGLVPFTELPVARSGDMDQASPVGESEVHSDGDQSTDTDEEGMDGSTMLLDKDSPIPHISFEADRSAGGVEPAYADSAEELPVGSMKVPILIVPKPGGVPSAGMECPPFQDIKASHHMLASQAGRAHSLDDSPTIKQRLALRLNDKKGQDLESGMSQSLNLLSPHSKGSTDSGYFSRSESAEQQISPPNTNIKTYEEIMFGRNWYYRPNSRSRQAITVGTAGAGPGALASLKAAGAVLEMATMGEEQMCFRGDLGVSGEAKQYPTGPCQSSTGLLEPPSESGLLIRTNSLPSSSPSTLSVPTGIRGSHSFDEMMTSNDVFYPPRRLTRQTAFEHPASEAQVVEAEGYGQMPKNVASSLGMKVAERCPAVPEHLAFGPHCTKVSLSEIATRKRRKEKSVGDEEDSPGHGDSSCSGSVEMMGDEFKHGSLDGSRATPTGKGSLHSTYSQSDSFDTCASTCSEDVALFADSEGRKSGGNVISVIQHTNSLSRLSSFEKSESFEQPGCQVPDKAPHGQFSEQSDSDIFEDALSPESALLRAEGVEPQAQSDSEQASLSSSSAAASPGQPYHIPHKLVRQPNIQVPEIRVTEEPDKPDKDAEAPLTKEADVEDFQLPQRSDTLSQMPSEKLPPKKKRLRLTDMEHSSGESSFESSCTSLSRSPSQESNLSHSSSFSMSFDRDEGLKSVSPSRQDDAAALGAPKQSEFLTVPGSGHASHHQQREMRRSSSEQAPCTLSTETPDMRSKSFDCGSLPSSRQGEIYCSASAMKERRRGYLVRQPSLSVYPEAVPQEPGLSELSIKPERPEHGTRHAPAEAPHGSSEPPCRARRGVSSAGAQAPSPRSFMSDDEFQQHQPFLQQSMSEDSLQEEPPHGRYGSRPPSHPVPLPLSTATVSTAGAHEEGPAPALPGWLLLPFFPADGPSLGSGRGPDSQTAAEAADEASRRPSCSSSQQTSAPFSARAPGLDGRAESLSSPLYSASLSRPSSSTAPVLLQQVQPVFATQNLGPQTSLPGLLVPVRIQTHVPTFGSVMYTSVTQLVDTQGSWPQGLASARASGPGGATGPAFNLLHFLGQTEAAGPCPQRWRSPDSPPEQQLQTGIPLSLTPPPTPRVPGAGAAKRMLSPASSLERFFQTKQQKRVKEERMYGQIVKELSAVELKRTDEPHAGLQPPASVDACERRSSSPPLDFLPVAAANVAVPVRSSAPHLPDVPRADSFTPPLQIVTERSPEASEAEPGSSPQSMMSSTAERDVLAKAPVSMLLRTSGPSGRGQPLLLTDMADVQQLFQFPSLRTTSRVSWCFLNYTKPSSSPAAAHGSVYSSWCVSSYNPNPLKLSTKATLALLRSKQRRSSGPIYTPAAISPPSSGTLVSSAAWKPRFDQLKPELLALDAAPLGRKMKGVASWERPKEETEEKEMSVKQPSSEPTRIKIFEGGYKSNEDYVYVRGRGRGKYICEECGIRCKKPSMLKKHIRTHTDVRPYVCKFCNFAFKTKVGNLTKHMKSKAHMKKCLELGVSMSSVEDNEADEGANHDSNLVSFHETAESEKTKKIFSSSSEAGEEGRGGSSRRALMEHQFSDAEDSTPRTRSRSTSPYSPPSLASSQPPPHLASDLLGSGHKPALFGYFTTVPSIQITAQAPPTGPARRGGARPEDGDVSDRDAHAGHLSPRRELSPLRHISPKRDLGVAGGYRRDLSPRRGPLSLLAPTGRDYKRDLSPRGRHRGLMRPVSPRRGLVCSRLDASFSAVTPVNPTAALSPQSRTRSVRPAPELEPGRSADVEMEHQPELLLPRQQDSPPHQVLFSHLPLHSQNQVRSPFPMIPIGGIQMVHSVPASAST
uniref:HIVEP zinc finger 2a n=1 Tax=Tetraodon nigroviridis TaxID=99883 RepID=H3CZF1_TETNG